MLDSIQSIKLIIKKKKILCFTINSNYFIPPALEFNPHQCHITEIIIQANNLFKDAQLKLLTLSKLCKFSGKSLNARKYSIVFNMRHSQRANLCLRTFDFILLTKKTMFSAYNIFCIESTTRVKNFIKEKLRKFSKYKKYRKFILDEMI